MGQGEFEILAIFTKYVLLPVIGFFTGFAVKWFLQERKSRDELLQALASQRADALLELWAIATLRTEITSLGKNDVVPRDLRETMNSNIVEWYTQKGGALFLSWNATQLVFRLLDSLRDEKTQRIHLEIAVSTLRTKLKYDCGVYSYWEEKRQLSRPRPPP